MSSLPAPDILILRQSLRRSAIATRDAVPLADRQAASRLIVHRLQDLLPRRSPIHCYISFRSEVETRPFIEERIREGLRVVVPIIEKDDAGREFLQHTEIAGLSQLRRGSFGLEEPVERSPASLADLGAVIVPLVAFDHYGMRLGYGKGFYDRFLQKLPRMVLRIGLAFAIQELDRIPVLPHDEGLDIVVTERETIRITVPETLQ